MSERLTREQAAAIKWLESCIEVRAHVAFMPDDCRKLEHVLGAVKALSSLSEGWVMDKMSDKGLLSEERIAFLTNGAVERGSESAIEWAIRQAVAEAREEAAKVAEQEGPDWYKHGKRIAAAIRRRVGR